MSKDISDSGGWPNLADIPANATSVELTKAQKLIRDMRQAGSYDKFREVINKEGVTEGIWFEVSDEVFRLGDHYMCLEFKDAKTPEECFAVFLKFKKLGVYSKVVFDELAEKMKELISNWYSRNYGGGPCGDRF